MLKHFSPLKYIKARKLASGYSDEMIWVTDEKGKIMHATSSTLTSLGYSSKKLRGCNMSSYIHQEDISNINDLFKSAFSNSNALKKICFISKNKKLQAFIVDSRHLKKESLLVHIIKKPCSYQSELDLLEIKHDTSRFLLKNMTDAVIVLNNKGNLVYAHGLQELLGYNEKEVIGTTAFAPVHPDDMEKTKKVFEDYIQNGELNTNRLDYRLLNSKGEYVWVEGSFKVIEDIKTREKLVLNNIRDISKRKKMEKQIKEDNQTKDKLFSIIAHDLRSPLSNISGFAHLLKENYKTDPEEKTLQNINLIYESNKQVIELVDNLLNWARMQTNRINVNKENINLNQLIKSILPYYKELIEKKSLFVDLQFSNQINVYADPNMIKTVLRNLISNAIKFSQQGGTITIKNKKTRDAFECIFIEDQGVGLSEEQIQKIMDDSDFSTTKGTGKEEGSGLGLNITREFVIKNGGTIEFQTNKDNGTSVKVCLPKAKKQ